MDSLERIINDYTDLYTNPLSNLDITVGLFDENNYYRCKVSILGAKDSPYHFGLFYMEYAFGNSYPTNPPKIRFLSPIYHPNINSRNYPELGLIQPNLINKGGILQIIFEIYHQNYLLFFIFNILILLLIWKKSKNIKKINLYLKKKQNFLPKNMQVHFQV